MQVADALYGFRLGFLAKALKHRCKRDKAAYVSGLADEVQARPAQAFGAVNALLCRRRKKPFAPAVLPSVRDKDGKPCASPADAMRRWRQHFSDLEAGSDVSPQQLGHLALSRCGRAWPMPTRLDCLPTPPELQRALLLAQSGKACGPDLLPGELGLACPWEMQQILYPLVLKLGLMGEESFCHKGGILTWLYKGRGAHDECSAFRGILLLSNVGKAIHRAFRPQIQRHFERHAPPLQLSGKRGGSVVFGSHIVRTFLRWREAQGLSSAAVFADVASAYYSAKRELASRHPAQEPLPHGDLEGTQSPGDEDSLDTQLSRPSALLQDGADEWLRALTTVLNEDTWTCLQNDGNGRTDATSDPPRICLGRSDFWHPSLKNFAYKTPIAGRSRTGSFRWVRPVGWPPTLGASVPWDLLRCPVRAIVGG